MGPRLSHLIRPECRPAAPWAAAGSGCSKLSGLFGMNWAAAAHSAIVVLPDPTHTAKSKTHASFRNNNSTCFPTTKLTISLVIFVHCLGAPLSFGLLFTTDHCRLLCVHVAELFWNATCGVLYLPGPSAHQTHSHTRPVRTRLDQCDAVLFQRFGEVSQRARHRHPFAGFEVPDGVSVRS